MLLSSGGAAQPAVDVHVGTFNAGTDQNMLRLSKHTGNLRRILGKGVEEGDLHLLGLCEIGGHKQGLVTEPEDAKA